MRIERLFLSDYFIASFPLEYVHFSTGDYNITKQIPGIKCTIVLQHNRDGCSHKTMLTAAVSKCLTSQYVTRSHNYSCLLHGFTWLSYRDLPLLPLLRRAHEVSLMRCPTRNTNSIFPSVCSLQTL